MSMRSKASATTSEPTIALPDSEDKGSTSVETGDATGEVGNGLEKGKGSLERDEDGVAIVEGVPIVGLKGPEDPLSPLNMSKFRRWLSVIVVSSCGFCVTCCSSMIAFTYPGMTKEFHVSQELATAGLSLFVLSLGLFPLVVAPLSQWYGRSPIYFVGFFTFIAFQGGVAASQDITALLVCRFFAGAGGAAFLSVAGGTVTDVFRSNEIASPMIVFSASTFAGPSLAPAFTAAMNQYLYWRVTWYVLVGWAALQLILLVTLVPETFLPAVLKKRAKQLRKAGRTDVRAPIELDQRSITSVLAVSCTEPFELLALEPMCAALCTLTALLLAILYLFFGAFNRVFTDAYNFEPRFVGLAFIPLFVGILIACGAQPLWSRQYSNQAKKLGRRPPPEEHLRKGIVGCILCTISVFWFAWTVQPSVPWIVPMISISLFGMGMLWSFASVFAFLVDAFRPASASSMAANSATRSCLAAAFPLFGPFMFDTLGNQWALTLCAFLLLAMCPFPLIFFKYGHRLRKGSKFANQED